ncbi:TetR/AcrR family transcriptional regulator [Microbacterium sp. No. 7]|uniref:TetR/AcrR family transcriptional regulator n=1 Tax=Microbacterium sp. No. 7 TaxID=1714373 RepID=UPI0006CFD1F2|nr:TetR/AcrR family transcriptional regulator [Microbacterium sp. No. 7]ALJ21187.1 hypothetical protein AOA12_15265 [Microbacterium sp. No. 7]
MTTGRPPASTGIRQEQREATRRRIVEAAQREFIRSGYQRATIDEIVAAAQVSRATLYLHFSSKSELMSAANEEMVEHWRQAVSRLIPILIAADRAGLRDWLEDSLAWFNENRPMALAILEVEHSQGDQSGVRRSFLDFTEPWVRTWPEDRHDEARLRFELCRVQIHNYMWSSYPPMFGSDEKVLDVFTDLWWNTLVVPTQAIAE